MSKVIDYIKSNKLEIIFLALIFIIGTLLRIVSFNHHGNISDDGLFTWYFASRNNVVSTIFELSKEDIHMPFYFVLLHFWIKLFGDSVISMRMCSLLISIPIPIIVFYFTKNLFNKTCAYFTSFFVAINAFCIFLSQEIRFYGLVFLLSFIVAFYFAKMLENYNKKNMIFFVLFVSLLFYTFSMTPLLILFYFIVGLIYVLKAKKQEIKKFILTFFAIFLVCLPVIILTLMNAVAMKTAITYYPIDNFPFNINIVYDILENFFTLENHIITKGNLHEFRNMFDNLNDPRYFACVFVPILIAIFGLIKSLFSKNKRLYLMLLPSLFFAIVAIILSKYSIIAMQTRYLSIVFIVFIVSFCFGLSLIKNKIVSLVIFVLFIYLNCINLLFLNRTVFNLSNQDFQSMQYTMDSYFQMNKNDYWIAPMYSTKLTYYVKEGKMIPFDFANAVVLKDKKSLEFYFGNDYKNITRENVRESLMDLIFDDIPHPSYKNNLKTQYIDKLKKGERIIYIPIVANLLSSPQEVGFTRETIKDVNLVVFLLGKCFRDTMLILDEYLELKQVIEGFRNYNIFVYEKI